MKKWYFTLLVASLMNLAGAFNASGSENNNSVKKAPVQKGAFKPQPYSSNPIWLLFLSGAADLMLKNCRAFKEQSFSMLGANWLPKLT